MAVRLRRRQRHAHGLWRTHGNAPLEALVIDYISLTGNDEAADPTVITEIAQYFEKELDYRIPDNYPFAGKDFNATSAGIHVDGLAKNEEIYNIFDTTKILNRSVPIIINDKAGRAGVAYWINQQFNLPPERQVSKKHPAVGQIHTRIMAAYEEGRNTSFSNKEIKNLVRRFMPELFDSEFDQMKRIAGELASNLVERLARDCQSTADSEALTAQLQHFVRDYSFIQYAYVTDVKGHSTAIAISDPRAIRRATRPSRSGSTTRTASGSSSPCAPESCTSRTSISLRSRASSSSPSPR